MTIWKDLLFLGGHVVTPAALEALRDAKAPAPAVSAPATPTGRPSGAAVPATLPMPIGVPR